MKELLLTLSFGGGVLVMFLKFVCFKDVDEVFVNELI